MKKSRSVESISFYSLTPLPYDYRRALQIIKDPRVDNQTEQSLRKLGIFFFRDNQNPSGLVLIPEQIKDYGDSLGLKFEEPLTAYYYQAQVEEKKGRYCVLTRKLGTSYDSDTLQTYRNREAKYGDQLWWDSWALHRTVREVTPSCVYLA